MIQKRHNIFETNSSTTHSLTIARNALTPEIIEQFKKEHGTHIIFGVNSYEDIRDLWSKDPIIDESTDFQIKADILYFAMYVWGNYENPVEFLYERNKLKAALENLGFTVEFNEDQKILEEYSWHHYDIYVNLFENMFPDINEAIDYLFYDHVLYYEWCDECMSECPEAIDEAEDRFANYNEEFKHYTYR